jgi:3-oxoacyl-[acyl-carrier-protein] synthase II
VITGVGAVTPFGVGREAMWKGLREARSTASRIRTFDASKFDTNFACQLPEDYDPDDLIENRKSVRTMSVQTATTVAAGNLAMRDARAEAGFVEPERFGVNAGIPGIGLYDLEYTEMGIQQALSLLDQIKDREPNPTDWLRNALDEISPVYTLRSIPNFGATHLAIIHNCRGESSTFATSCTSSLQAIGDAFRLIRSGVADAMLAGGSDTPCTPEGLLAFLHLGVLSKRNDNPQAASRPFDKDRDGFVMGEGGVVLLLEEFEAAKKRGAPIYAEVLGYACTQDAYRLTDEPPDGRGSVLAMQRAMLDAKVKTTEIDYINAHGTSTVMNDVTETLAIRQVFGDHAPKVPISSTKSMVGHLLTAAGSVEVAACCFALTEQLIPPTINHEIPDPKCDLDYVPGKPRESRLRTILKNSFGFGGQNACLVLRQVE